LSTQELCNCQGVGGSIILFPDRMVVKHGGPASSHSHEIPLTQVRAVLVERKSVIPFATVTVLAVVAAILAKYNPVWFLANLSDKDSTLVSFAALSIAVLFVVPVVVRSAFVSVSVSSEGETVPVRLGFVSSRPAKRLTKRFRELSIGS
jgi:hypothetical protein